MNTKVISISTLKQLFIEIVLNKTDKISDISDDSVLNATAYGVAKVAQKAIKDNAITISKWFPDTATGTKLDEAAGMLGVSPRKGALGSSTYVKVVASPNTTYLQSNTRFSNNNGIAFEMESDFTVDSTGLGYIKIRSLDTGSKTNIDPISIINVTPKPNGHVKVTNEYRATGGLDNEDDEIFRIRIKNNLNILSQTTLEYFTQIFQNIDDRVLRVINLGTNEEGKRELTIVTQNGVNLLDSELEDLLNASKDYFPITDKNRFGDLIGIKLSNPTWFEVGQQDLSFIPDGDSGIDFRLSISDSSSWETVRKDIQINLSKYLDFRFWEPNTKISWTELLDIVQNTKGVKYVPNTTFYPNQDEIVPINQLPRVKRFKVRQLDGTIVYDSAGTLTPVFYPVN